MTKYNVVYTGRILDGYDRDHVRDALIQDFNFPPAKADRLLDSGRVYLKKDLDARTAKTYGTALKKAGLHVVLTRCDPTLPPATPSAMQTEDTQPAAGAFAPAAPPKKRPAITRTVAEKPIPFAFYGTGTEYFKIWIVNLILSILTLGIYSAWAKVRRKQYFYGSTQLNGSSFEYLADPKNILKGRIIVGVFFIAYSGVSNIFPVAGSVLSILFIIIMPWLVVRTLAFNARNSSYKNIRFGFSGTVKEAAKVFVLFPVLVPFTLGILGPYVYYRQKKFIVDHSSYGKTLFKFTATQKDYYAMVFKALIPIVAGLVLAGLSFKFFPPASGLFVMALYLYLFAYFSVKTTNLIYNSTVLNRHSFNAFLETRGYLWLIIVNTLGTVLTLGVFYPWAHIRTIRYKLTHIIFMAKGDLDNFVAQEQQQVSALGEEAGDFFDLDIGL